MKELRSKSNKKFMVLSAIGILMVVDHHTWITFNLFGDFIPYNSFFMPMFVFISGYFNKVDSSTNLIKYTGKKVKTLLLPYIGVSFLAFVLQFFINWFKLGHIEPVPSGYLLYLLERIVTIGSSISIAEPMWFVISLFAVLMVYAVCKKLLGKIWNSYVAVAVFVALHILSVYLAKNVLPVTTPYILLPLKIMFFMPFLEMGIIYRDKLEGKHSDMSGGLKLGLMAILLLINAVRTTYLPYAYDVAFDSLGEMEGFTSPFIVTPLISSIVGILFWLTMVELIAKPVGESKFVNYMSCNTFWIMGLHVAFFNIVNCVLMFVSRFIVWVPYFDIEAFQESEWYMWEISPTIKLLYLLAGVFGPLGLKLIYDKICILLGKAFKKKEKE